MKCWGFFFCNDSLSLYEMSVRPSDNVRLHVLVNRGFSDQPWCKSRACVAVQLKQTCGNLNEHEKKQRTLPNYLFPEFILGRTVFVLQGVFIFWMVWQSRPETNWNECRAHRQSADISNTATRISFLTFPAHAKILLLNTHTKMTEEINLKFSLSFFFVF